MAYNYQTERHKLFTDEGQRDFLKIRDAAKRLLSKAGAFQMGNIISEAAIGGDSWFQLACVDRLAELGEIHEITREKIPGQYRVFVEAGK